MRPVQPACEATLASLPERVLAGVSGGLDSVALLHAVVRTGRHVVALHFDHGWRAESGADGAFVQEFARGLGIRCVTGKMRAAKTKSEAEARHARYAFFARTARRLKLEHIVLAHHADDQVETFLLQLLRGSGSAARGMDTLAQRDGLILHRPWLGVWKQEITAYAKQQKLAWRDDPTNADTRHRRNLLRRRVIPYLRQQISPHVTENLWRAAEILRAESEWLDALCAAAASKPELPVRELRAMPLGQQRRTILRWLQARGIAGTGFAETEALRALLDRVAPAKVNLPAGKFARRRAGKIFIV